MTGPLEVLSTHRQPLLLAELAGWLHDIGKFCDLHVEHHCEGGTRKWPRDYAYKAVVNEPARVIRLSKQAANLSKPAVLNDVLANPSPRIAEFLSPEAREMLETGLVRIGDEEYSLAELVMLGMPGFAGHPNRTRLLQDRDGWLPAMLGVCHSEGHYDKPDPGRRQLQSVPAVLVSTPFGYETQRFILGDPERGLDARLQTLKLCPAALDGLRALIRRLDSTLRDGLADTRRPINEVTLADWGFAVAAMLKSALAGHILTSAKVQIRRMLGPDELDHDLRWHVVWLRVNALDFWSRAVRLPDLLARQGLINDALGALRTRLEDQTPLANEIYRDETGVAFLAPALPGCDDSATQIERLFQQAISRAFAESRVAGEVVPELLVRPADKAAVGLHVALRQAPEPTRADPAAVAGFWAGPVADLCPVCGLRPQAPARSSAGRLKLCEVCAGRRVHRAREWAASLSTTIWTDEVADVSRRLALLVGRFDLQPWLDGTMVRTLLVTDPADGAPVAKNPSFARLRRIWETTRRFWQEVLPTEKGADLAGSLCGQLLPPVDRRLVIRPANLDALGLEPWHAYDLVLGQARLSVLCREGDLISLDNLRYLARQPGLGRDVKECLVQRPDLAVEEPVGHGSPNRLLGRLVVSSVVEERTPYLPAIPILAEPRTFMALLPAAEALRVAQAIAQKYGREMGKVCHRLALTLGLVYFGRRMPLAAALDAGRHMLDRPCDPREAGVRAVELQECSPEGWPARVALRLAVGEREVRLTVPTVMGDGKTPDVWYPYWRLVAPADGGTRCREFLGPDGGRWVHVADLRPADRVQLVPSTFDYEHLDVAARRYEVAYDGGHRRGADRCHRPYLLEELADLERVWQLAGPPEAMATSQAVGLVALVEAKRTAWGLPRGDEALKLGHDRPFATFCRDALATLAWRRRPWKGLPEEDRHLLERAALSGMLADVLELHLTLGTEGASEEEERCILSGVSS